MAARYPAVPSLLRLEMRLHRNLPAVAATGAGEMTGPGRDAADQEFNTGDVAATIRDMGAPHFATMRESGSWFMVECCPPHHDVQ